MTATVSVDGDGAEQARAAFEECIAAGGIAIFPADTVYGLACDPLDATAVRGIHELKGRAPGKPSAVMFFAPLAMRELIGGLGPRARATLAALLPGPVTLVVANREHRYPLACGDDAERLGLRLIEGPLAGARAAVLQSSANRSGATAPRSPAELDEDLRSSVDLVVDGGELAGAASTVVDVSQLDASGEWRLLREGPIGAAEVERALEATGEFELPGTG